MQASVVTKPRDPDASPAELTPETRETAARLGALLRYVFLFDQGEHLRAIEESGLTMTQFKGLLILRHREGAQPVGELAEALGLSVAAVSRAVEALVKRRLVTRAADEVDRRVRRVAISAKGEALANALIATRLAGLEGFAASLTAAQRRKLDAAVASLFDRDEIAAAYKQLKAVGK
jgi:DNA-binding MarR family transcriptional regulator